MFNLVSRVNMHPRALSVEAPTRSACRVLHTSSLLATPRTSTPAAAPPADSSDGTADEKPRTVSAAAYLAAQAAEEEAAAALADKKKERVVPDPDAWTGEESRERMLKRILEDQYKPLRVKVRCCLVVLSLAAHPLTRPS